MPDSDTCACGDVLDEHVEDGGRIGACQVDDCGCVYFEADPDDGVGRDVI